MLENKDLIASVQKLFEQANIQVSINDIKICAGGGNNRTYQIETQCGTFAVKKYFSQPGDQRDRLAAEFSFLTYAQFAAPNQTPIPYAFLAQESLALYEFIVGQPFKSWDIDGATVDQAIEFFTALNSSPSVALPFASEACFSIQAHLDLIESRIIGLQAIPPNTAEDRAAALLSKKIYTYWQDLVKHIKASAKAYAMDLYLPLKQSLRCISPSDFGFHNALKTADGTLRFLDFEYAGWDDPAKMVGDFFAQLAVPVSESYFDLFVERVMQPFEQPEFLIQRALLLCNVYQIKWFCIALNVFIPVHMARRRFANPHLNETDLKQNQLLKAEKIAQKLGVISSCLI